MEVALATVVVARAGALSKSLVGEASIDWGVDQSLVGEASVHGGSHRSLVDEIGVLVVVEDVLDLVTEALMGVESSVVLDEVFFAWHCKS